MSNGIQVSVDGSKMHYVRDVRVKRSENAAVASGYVSGKYVIVTYTGEVTSDFGVSEAKPWLRQVRRDLVRKYIATYGDVVRGTHYTLLVDGNFINELIAAGLKVDEKGTVTLASGDRVQISGMSQVDALLKIKQAKSEAILREREIIKKLLAEIAA